VIERLHREIVSALRMTEVREPLQGLGLEPVGNTPEAFDALIKTESRKWIDIVRKANIQPQE